MKFYDRICHTIDVVSQTSVLVTGASGFLGSELSEYLESEGFKVYRTDIWGENLDFKGDLRQSEFLQSIFVDQTYDVVIHSAALVPLVDSKNDFFHFNVEVSSELAAVSKKHRVKHFILISSSAVYGVPKDFPITRSTPTGPVEDYGSSKLSAENAVQSKWGSELGLTIIRPRTIVGKNRLGIFEILFRWISQGYFVPFPNAGKHYLQLVHVRDLSRLVLHSISNKVYGIWPAGTPKYNLLVDDLKLGVASTGQKILIINIPNLVLIITAKILRRFKLSPFAPWHYQTLGSNFAFDDEWSPPGFQYEYSNIECITEALEHYTEKGVRRGESAHTKSWPTIFLDMSLGTFSRVVRLFAPSKF